MEIIEYSDFISRLSGQDRGDRYDRIPVGAGIDQLRIREVYYGDHEPTSGAVQGIDTIVQGSKRPWFRDIYV